MAQKAHTPPMGCGTEGRASRNPYLGAGMKLLVANLDYMSILTYSLLLALWLIAEFEFLLPAMQ